MNVLEQIPFFDNQAVVFDIDDTLITSDTHQPMPKTLSLFKYCVNRGYNVYIITARARTNEAIKFTLQQLSSHGITGFRSIAFRNPNDFNIPKFKEDARKSIPQTVIMSVGDQPWDIGKHGGVGVIVRR
jgi:predicted HAD superfamily phosphohydrolase YqeG